MLPILILLLCNLHFRSSWTSRAVLWTHLWLTSRHMAHHQFRPIQLLLYPPACWSYKTRKIGNWKKDHGGKPQCFAYLAHLHLREDIGRAIMISEQSCMEPGCSLCQYKWSTCYTFFMFMQHWSNDKIYCQVARGRFGGKYLTQFIYLVCCWVNLFICSRAQATTTCGGEVWIPSS